MKRSSLIILLIILACIVTGVFLCLKTDLSSAFEEREEALSRITSEACSHGVNVKSEANENIIEDPEIGVLYVPYDYALPVPESEAAELSYFERCVFIGDSRMLGLVRYTDVEPINYCSVGFSVAEYDKAAFVKLNGENFTVKEALRENNDFDAVYVATGLNELGWTMDNFVNKYKEMIADIKGVAGNRPIYLQSIMPVTVSFEVSRIMNPFKLKNSSVPEFNEKLKEIAEEYRVFYLDCSGLFVLEDGTLDPGKSTDGAHLTREAYAKQLDFYKTHVVQTKNRILVKK